MPGHTNFPGSESLFSAKPGIFKFVPRSLKTTLASSKWYISFVFLHQHLMAQQESHVLLF